MHWVFAYGSNMHLPDLRRWLREAGYGPLAPRRVEPACIADFALTWDYRSIARDGGAANASPRPGALLKGLALHADDELLAALDRKEGHPGRYDRGTRPLAARLLHREETVDAWLYRVTPEHRTATPVPPRRAYLRLLLEAAAEHDLGADHLAALRRIPTLD